MLLSLLRSNCSHSSADGRGIGVGCKAESGKLKVDTPFLKRNHLMGIRSISIIQNQEQTRVPVLTDKKIQHRVIGWSEWLSCGTNGCGITLKYRYNDGLKLCEINWDGSLTAPIGGNTAGYIWSNFPNDKKPRQNVFVPAVYPGGVLVVRFYPVTNDGSKNQWTITSLKDNVNSAYVCGTFIYSYA